MPRNLEQIVEDCGALSLGESVAAWKRETNGKAIGCFPVYVPEEILHAGGILPVGILGEDGASTERADTRLPSFVCAIARRTLDRALRHDLNALDGMLFPGSCDVARHLAGIWHRNFPERLVETVHLPQNPDSRHSVDFLKGEFDRLRRVFGHLAGVRITDRQIRAAIRTFDENRGLISELYAVRREAPWRIRHSEIRQLLRAGAFMPRDRHSGLLREALASLQGGDRRRRDGLRVVLEGGFCEPPPADLLEALEEAGCLVVDDDLMQGRRWFECAIDADGDPLASLAGAWLRHSVPSSVRYGGALPRAEALVAKVKRTHAGGVVFAAAKFCEPASFDSPPLRTALEREGIPWIAVEYEDKSSGFDAVRSQAEAFVESSLFFA
ncbi:MAG: 2-hydroxyacyl-CoA dehydratase [Planctomycetes bacterium]|nr:2-hydroxyacyl-CoA dehydratase [Planctomycetota bacterium]